jgi:sigma-E factor negative regulatory protein RseC
MIEEIGTVVEVDGNVALVRTERGSACEGCGSSGFCHMAEGDSEATVEAENVFHAAVGQKVRVAIPTASFLKGTFFLYMFPLIGFFSGVGCGLLIADLLSGADRDLFAALGGALGLLLFFVLQRFFNRNFERSRRFRPVIRDIID